MRPSLRASSGWPARVLTVLALVLPIPLCAALGLSLPLPSTVARIAAKLVPFGNSAVLNAKEEQLLGARGSIVRFPGELGGNVASSLDPGAAPAVLGPHNAGGGVPGGNVDGSTTASANGTATIPADPKARPTLVGNSTSTPSTGGTPPKGGGDPVPPNAPPTVVGTATAAAGAVVGTVTTTATTATTTVAGTAAPAVGVVTGVVGPVLPPKP